MKSAATLAPLKILFKALKQKSRKRPSAYTIPNQWSNDPDSSEPLQCNPYHFWRDTVQTILKQPATPRMTNNNGGGSWSRYAVIYNLFVRTATAFDHDGDGRLSTLRPDGFRETGTFMKSIALLPYIKSLGCNTIHLLPVTAVGKDGNKGDAGSPYAIRNPYELDPTLAEPNLELGVEAEFAAFAAAAHHLGIRIVMEFVFRTASKDGDWVKDHPEWFYWLDNTVPDRQPGNKNRDHYGMPLFTTKESAAIKRAVDLKQFDHLLPPHAVHRNMFLPPPHKDHISLEDGRWIARYPDGRTARIPGAFADWPVDDPQPPWGDVTYLRLYDHPDFNYIGYNTIRMYSSELAQPANAVHALWETIINIIPHYQKKYAIDGAMIDMGHALPMPLKQQIVAAARLQNPDFAFWDENFEITINSVREGYNAVMGELPFAMHEPAQLEKQLKLFAFDTVPLTCFGGPENHNTPRAASKPGGTAYSRFAFAVAAFLPTMPFVHNGFELGEQIPINTGLGFTPAEIAHYPSEQLPLFSAVPLNWENNEAAPLTEWIRKTLQLRAQSSSLFTERSNHTISIVQSSNPYIWALVRHTADWSKKMALLVNQDFNNNQSTLMWLPTGREFLQDHYSSRLIPVHSDQILVRLTPGECYWLEL